MPPSALPAAQLQRFCKAVAEVQEGRRPAPAAVRCPPSKRRPAGPCELPTGGSRGALWEKPRVDHGVSREGAGEPRAAARPAGSVAASAAAHAKWVLPPLAGASCMANSDAHGGFGLQPPSRCHCSPKTAAPDLASLSRTTRSTPTSLSFTAPSSSSSVSALSTASRLRPSGRTHVDPRRSPTTPRASARATRSAGEASRPLPHLKPTTPCRRTSLATAAAAAIATAVSLDMQQFKSSGGAATPKRSPRASFPCSGSFGVPPSLGISHTSSDAAILGQWVTIDGRGRTDSHLIFISSN
mmetsp:Transcript_49053/g.91273  ORF Transcript_49053/g.91273 Transcript_49053/m.91273 type:complete len:298 (-) Transcript_49053:17-910(-)